MATGGAFPTVKPLMGSAEKKKKCTYDRVGLFRLDVVYLNAINIGDANEKAVTPRALGTGEMNDRMFYGSRSNANVWATQRFDNVERYVQKYEELWSEGFLRFLFRNIRVKQRHICFKRIRADGRVDWRDKKRYGLDASCFTSTSTESKVETNVKSSKINVAVFGCAFGAKAQAAAKQIMKTKKGKLKLPHTHVSKYIFTDSKTLVGIGGWTIVTVEAENFRIEALRIKFQGHNVLKEYRYRIYVNIEDKMNVFKLHGYFRNGLISYLQCNPSKALHARMSRENTQRTIENAIQRSVHASDALLKWHAHLKPIYPELNTIQLIDFTIWILDTHHRAFAAQWMSMYDMMIKWDIRNEMHAYSFTMSNYRNLVLQLASSNTRLRCGKMAPSKTSAPKTDLRGTENNAYIGSSADFAIHTSIFGNFRNEESGLGERLKAFNKFNADRYLFTDSKTIGKVPGWTVVRIAVGKDVNGIPASRLRAKEIKFRGHALLNKYRYRIHVDTKRKALKYLETALTKGLMDYIRCHPSKALFIRKHKYRKRVQDEIKALKWSGHQHLQPQAALDKWEEHIKPMYEKVNAVRLPETMLFALDTHHVAFVEKWDSIFDTLSKWGLWRDQVVYSYAMVDLQDKVEHINSRIKPACRIFSRPNKVDAEHPTNQYTGYLALASTGSDFKRRCCLNNNIMLTVGRIVEGCKLAGKNNVVVLPPDLDSGGAWRTKMGLINEDAIQQLIRLAKQNGCTLVSASMAKTANLSMQHYSGKGFVDSGPYIRWFYRSMQLPPALAAAHSKCYPSIHTNYTAVHLHIELDWYPYCHTRTRRNDSVKACYTPREIALAIRELQPATLVLLYGKEAKEFAKGTGEHPLEIEWNASSVHHKSTTGNHCEASMSKLSYVERAMVDQWTAIHAQHFVGTLMSTFSNGATIARTQRKHNYNNWVYSCPEIAPLVQRVDGGELSGAKSDEEACRRNGARKLSTKVEDSAINDFAIYASIFGNYRNEEKGLGKRLKAFNKWNADRYLFTDSKTIGKIPGWTVVRIAVGKAVNGIPANRVIIKDLKFRGHALLKKYRYRIHVDTRDKALDILQVMLTNGLMDYVRCHPSKALFIRRHPKRKRVQDEIAVLKSPRYQELQPQATLDKWEEHIKPMYEKVNSVLD